VNGERPFSRQQFANALGKDLIDDAAGSAVHALDGPALASDMVEENDPIPKHSQAVKALQFAFERPDVPFFFLQILLDFRICSDHTVQDRFTRWIMRGGKARTVDMVDTEWCRFQDLSFAAKHPGRFDLRIQEDE